MRVYVAGQREFGRAVLERVIACGHEVVGVCAPPWNGRGEQRDRLRALAEDSGFPWLPAGELREATFPEGVDVLVAAHSHDFISRKVRLRCKLGAIGYHPSLLPLHRGRDAVRWTIRDRDRVAGGSVYWLSENIDGGAIAAQDWCFVRPDDTAEELWRRELAPMGVRLIGRVLDALGRGYIVAVPQDPKLATREPAFDAPPLHRPDLPEIGDGGWAGYAVSVSSDALHKES